MLEILRSSFFPADRFSGTRLFLYATEGRFLVTSRWQDFGEFDSLDEAVRCFDETLLG